MTLHCLVPEAGLPALAGGPLTADGTARLRAAALQDAMVAAEGSGGELLVSWPTEGRPPEAVKSGTTAEAELRALAEEALDDPGSVRFEPQVGESFAERAANAAAHLEEEASVAVLPGTAPTLDRTALDGAAMRLRRVPVVLAPGTGGRVPYVGLAEPLDLDGAFESPAVETLAGRAVDAGHDVEFLGHHPVIESRGGLASVVAAVRARRRADRPVPEHTARAVEELDLRVGEGGVRVGG